MRTGFYQVTEAPRWGGYVHRGSGGVIQSGLYPISDLDGKIGFFDKRLLELRDPRNKNSEAKSTGYVGGFYSSILGDALNAYGEPKAPHIMPLIFRPEVLDLGGRNEWFVASFFKESELRELTSEQARKQLHPLVMRRYGDLEILPIKPESEDRPGEMTNPLTELEVPCLMNIPLYLPFTDKKQVARRIREDEKSIRKTNAREFRMTRAQMLEDL